MDMRLLILLPSLCGLTLGQGFCKIDPLVSTKSGLIRGLRDSKGYSKFLGVPYGKIDGNKIFGAAVPHPGFDDTFEAYDDSNICAQVNYQGVVTGTIDCLNLNIYVPDTADSKNRLPVMVWIHGGGFIQGSAVAESGDPHSLLRHDVIVVAINYRLGIFGFMCLDIPEVPGNTGLKDQVLALRWINENIEAFGGDSNRITVFGESAGAMSANLHLFSNYEKLFHRAIIQSGPANSYWSIVESDNTIPIRLAAQLGFNTIDIEEALFFLSDVDAHILVQTAHYLKIAYADVTNRPLTKPCIEQEFEDVESFITDHPMNIESNKVSTTSIIIGHNSVELAYHYADVDATFFNTYDFSQPFVTDFDLTNDNLGEALEVVKHFYIGDEDISENVRWKIIDFGSDFIFSHPTQRMAQKLLENGAGNIYRYVFSYNGDIAFNKTWYGATHTEELPYLFDLTKGGKEKSPHDQHITDVMTALWTNFAKFGDPAPEISELLPVKWTPITATHQPYLTLDYDLALNNRPFHDRMAFWDLFYKQYGQLQKWYKAEDKKK